VNTYRDGTFCIFISFFFSSRRRHTRFSRDWSSDVCSSDLKQGNRLLCFFNGLAFDQIRHHGAGSHADGTAFAFEFDVFNSVVLRSEERRVGKECISRWLSYHEKEGHRENEAETTSRKCPDE